jgi:hypothetical protein
MFFRCTADHILLLKWFSRIKKLLKKHALLTAWRSWFSFYTSWCLLLHIDHSSNHFASWIIYSQFSFKEDLSSLCWSPSSIELSFMTSHTPIFLSHIHLFSFFSSVFLVNKTIQLPFHDYIAFPETLLLPISFL